MRKYSLGLKHIKKGNTEEMKKEKEKTFRKLEHWEIVTLGNRDSVIDRL